MPRLILFGGPNGAGKTTIALQVLAQLGCRHFVNADAIAAGLSPLANEIVALQAGVLMRNRLRQLRDKNVDFATESTLAARTYVPFVRDCQTRDYRFHLIYLWLPTPELAIARVAARVRAGGHDIPRETIVRRYEAGRRNFSQLYRPLADKWEIYDSSPATPKLVAQGEQNPETEIMGRSIVVWQDGRVVHVPPSQLTPRALPGDEKLDDEAVSIS